MTKRFERFACVAHRASRALAAPLFLAALAGLAACTDAPQPTGPAGPGRPSLVQVATGPVVTSTADPGDGTCDDAGTGDGCTLREAITFADAGANITFATGVTGTITLAPTPLPGAGYLLIDKALTITGPGARSLAVSGNDASTVFIILPGVAVTISGLTVTGGNGNTGSGGGIVIFGTLTLTRCTVTGNRAGSGGGIANGGTLTVVQSTVSGNSAMLYGGGIIAGGNADLGPSSTTVLNSTVSGNTAESWGGGIYNFFGVIRVLYSTVTANQAPNGGGLGSTDADAAHIDVGGSVIAGNTSEGSTPNDVATFLKPTTARFRSLGYNVVGAAGANVDFNQEFNQTTDQRNVTDPAVLRLGPLADNGGPTNTHAVLAGSAALDNGDPAFDPSAFTPPLATDQRGTGFARVSGGRIDVGAFELQQASKLTQTITFASLPPTATVGSTATVSATASSGLTVSFNAGPANVCNLSGTTLNFVGAGDCAVTANQPGNATYGPADAVTQTISVVKASQTITFPPITPNPAKVSASATLGATASSGLAVGYSSLTPGVCTVTGSTVTYDHAGTCTVAADQAGNAGYDPAAQATRGVTVEKNAQAITFTSTAPAPAYVKGTYTVAATGGASGNGVTITVGPPNVCTMTANTVSFVGVGTCTITANQAGNNAYAAAAPVTQSVKVAYRFDGFLGSVKNGDVLNVANAGQVIPLQWRLTDASGAPVTTLTSVQITATDLNCALGATGGQVAEQPSGASGLQNLGNGYYQYNWKSPVSYAKSCKTVQLDLGEGTGAHTARFAFSK